ncbi:MAG: hypothetical protein EOP59_02945, partial [Sphingomonadales bacterium]
MRKIGGTIAAGVALVLMGTCSMAPEPMAHTVSAPLPPVAEPVVQARGAPNRNEFSFDGPMIQGGSVLGTAPA